MNFCGECGAPLQLRCPQCGTENPPRFEFCGACGTPLSERPRDSWEAQTLRAPRPVAAGPRAEAERRQLTVLFCDLVDSTPLATQLDPEELREVIRAYHAVCVQVIEGFEGHIAQYLGDGLLVYFGYPRAHEDDALRAVRAGLGIIEALGPLQKRLQQEQRVRLAVRVGIHTGLVVVGDIGEGTRHERLALGEVPNLAARLQGLAPPDTVLISASTARLVQGWFVGEALDDQTLKGFPEPMTVYRVLAESGVQSRLDLIGVGSLTPLVGREQELKVLVERWEHAKEGLGQVVVLRGEAGIGKSRLLRALQDRLADEPYTRLECRGSPYAQHSALFPVINLGRRLLQWQRDEIPGVTLEKLEAALAPYDVVLSEVVPLLASLLSLPPAERYPPLQFTPERQKQKTLEAILGLLQAHAARQPVLFIVEDLHWIDPSTLELLTLLIDQGPRGRILTLLTARPEFQPPWGFGGHVTSLTLDRLPPTQVERIIDGVTGGKRLPAEVCQQVVSKTDGVPLFVEELTKMVVESGLLREQADHYELQGPLHSLDIPTTLHDSLMARLDRLGNAKEVAQLAATLGRAFPYELLQAVSPWDEERLQRALTQLVEAELLDRRGVPPHTTWVFKHALIQEAAYQSLLRSTRQQYHRQTVRILEQRFPDVVETRPELLAYYCMEAGLPGQAVPYWQQAGQRAVERSANVEAISHFTKGLELLKTLPETPERIGQELRLNLAMGAPLMIIKGQAAPEVEQLYTRALELGQQVGDNAQHFAALKGLVRFNNSAGRFRKAREVAELGLVLAQRVHDQALRWEAHVELGSNLFFLGELVLARLHLEQGLALYTPEQSYDHVFRSGAHPQAFGLSHLAWTLWLLGYPDCALTRSQEGLDLARQLSHPFILARALHYAASVHQFRREASFVQECAEAMMVLSREHGFTRWLGRGMVMRGWALVEQKAVEEGIQQLQEGIAVYRAVGDEVGWPIILASLAEAYGKAGQPEAGLRELAAALAVAYKTQELRWEAELHRLKGELLLQSPASGPTASLFTPHFTRGMSRLAEAEAFFGRALEVARRQQAKSLELRAALSLSRLWQSQGKRTEARHMLSEIYAWFTEGFETLDLQEAKGLLEVLQ
jgi:class 3 adenylate cyclase/predicted ATPase